MSVCVSPTHSGGGTPVQRTSADEAADLFDLAAPSLQQPLVARLVPLYAELPTLHLHQDTRDLIVGRGKDIPEDYRINASDKISARHCELIVDSVTLRVELRDISSNGTFVNGVRLSKGKSVALQNGDRVELTRPPDSTTGGQTSSSPTPDIAAKGRVSYIFQRLKQETTRAHMRREVTCALCSSVFHRPCSVLPCAHVFCAGCISRWIAHNKSNACPECSENVTDIRPTHRLQVCAENFLVGDPASRRGVEELAQLDAADKIPPSGMKLGKRSRSNSDDEDNSRSSSDVDKISPLRHAALIFKGVIPLAGPQCAECCTSSAIDGFRCPAGGPHLCCSACRTCFADRPLCGRPQRCHVCNLAFCHLYRPGGCMRSEAMSFRPLRDQDPVTVLPPHTFNGNTVEQGILSTYLASHNILIKDVWSGALAKLDTGEWVPNMVLINGAVKPDSAVCQECAAAVFAELLFEYRRRLSPDTLPGSVAMRSNCWFGKECRTQFHIRQHAENFNHVCYQEKRKE